MFSWTHPTGMFDDENALYQVAWTTDGTSPSYTSETNSQEIGTTTSYSVPADPGTLVKFAIRVISLVSFGDASLGSDATAEGTAQWGATSGTPFPMEGDFTITSPGWAGTPPVTLIEEIPLMFRVSVASTNLVIDTMTGSGQGVNIHIRTKDTAGQNMTGTEINSGGNSAYDQFATGTIIGQTIEVMLERTGSEVLTVAGRWRAFFVYEDPTPWLLKTGL